MAFKPPQHKSAEKLKALADKAQTPALVALIERLPHRPYATQDLRDGCSRMAPEKALQRAYIQVNPAVYVGWLVFDIDRPYSAYAWEDELLPPPNAIATNPANGHAHLFYGLKVPVAMCDSARVKPLAYLAVVEQHFRQKLKADPGYAGLLAKNPLNPSWRLLTPRAELYELCELAEYVPAEFKAKKRKAIEPIGFGRNCTLFDNLRVWAYSMVLTYQADASLATFQGALLGQAETINTGFASPLNSKEVLTIAKSVAKWTWRRFSSEAFSQIQSRRGKKGGLKGCGGRPNVVGEPWVALGISRATWYRRQAKQTKDPKVVLAGNGARGGT